MMFLFMICFWKIVNSHKDDTVAGYDEVTMKLLNYVIELIVTSLVNVFNPRKQQSTFPDNLKIVMITYYILKAEDCK